MGEGFCYLNRHPGSLTRQVSQAYFSVQREYLSVQGLGHIHSQMICSIIEQRTSTSRNDTRDLSEGIFRHIVRRFLSVVLLGVGPVGPVFGDALCLVDLLGPVRAVDGQPLARLARQRLQGRCSLKKHDVIFPFSAQKLR